MCIRVLNVEMNALRGGAVSADGNLTLNNMKTEPLDFLDDAPINWNKIDQPARDWDYNPPTRLTAHDTALAGVVGLAMAVVALAGIVLLFVW